MCSMLWGPHNIDINQNRDQGRLWVTLTLNLVEIMGISKVG